MNFNTSWVNSALNNKNHHNYIKASVCKFIIKKNNCTYIKKYNEKKIYVFNIKIIE